MTIILLLIIGFFLNSGDGVTFGSNVIAAFDLTSYFVFFIAILVTILVLLIQLVIYYSSNIDKVWIVRPFSTIASIYILSIIYLQVYLCSYVIDNTNVFANSFSELSSDVQLAILSFIGITILNIFTSRSKTVWSDNDTRNKN